jgi:hypothetical protein
MAGLSTAFSLGAGNKLERGALLEDVAALHVTVGNFILTENGVPSISTQIAALRRLLSGQGTGELGRRFRDVAEVRVFPSPVCPVINNTYSFRAPRLGQIDIGGPSTER